MFRKNGLVICRKPFFKFEEFLEQYKKDREDAPESEFVVHFRISTSGLKDELNTHPHRIADDFYVVHNGVLTGWHSSDGKKSDTVMFTDRILKLLYKEYGGVRESKSCFMYSSAVVELLEGYIGSYNKMVLFNQHQSFILNEKSGEWVDMDGGKVWFSNSYWKTYATATYPSKYAHYYGRDTYAFDDDDSASKKKPETQSTSCETNCQVRDTAQYARNAEQQSLLTDGPKTQVTVSRASKSKSDSENLIKYEPDPEYPGSFIARLMIFGEACTVNIQKSIYKEEPLKDYFEVDMMELKLTETTELVSFENVAQAKQFIYLAKRGIENAYNYNPS